MYRIRQADGDDREFLIEMARHACTLEDRPLPKINAPDVLASLPPTMSAAVIATDHEEDPLGTAWWHLHEPPLAITRAGSPVLEPTMAVIAGARDRGFGTGPIEALASNVATQFPTNRAKRSPAEPREPPVHAHRLSSRWQGPRALWRGDDPQTPQLNPARLQGVQKPSQHLAASTVSKLHVAVA